MIKRILLLKFVSWFVLSPVFALAPIQPVRISGEPVFQTLCEKGSFELHYRRASWGLEVLLTETNQITLSLVREGQG